MSCAVTAIRRYPVKSMGGEPLERVTVDPRGLQGDRWYAVVDGEGRLASAKDSRRFRRRDEILDYTAATRDGQVLVTGPEGTWPVGDPALDAVLTGRTGSGVQVLPERDVPHQDGGAVSLVGTATLDWCAQRWGVDADPRRLRVNLVVATTEPFVEETWTGRALVVGVCTLRVVERIPRCRTIDVRQDGVEPRGRWLRPLGTERDACLAVYADVVSPGEVGVGDRLRVEDPASEGTLAG
ncbi:MOSC domain-containing protein [Ornithinimicrobium pekingense]|uniref:Molybdenum cofactor sulfurase n=1 Tax=Ornithinimicrobium pekingense TaxID=384677 RepID=A0ABQ2FAH8_9MICO|nr:MOSC N-terminal beta barrel domain-containing protein [Ornithinimicrobium pekingense]GGK73273.1 molybdenum cofactor sulfurase [Ornithinimicrobium pekingense]